MHRHTEATQHTCTCATVVRPTDRPPATVCATVTQPTDRLPVAGVQNAGVGDEVLWWRTGRPAHS